MRASQFILAGAVTAAVAFPAGAHAGTDSVVTLSVPATTTCEQVVFSVTADHGITPRTVYTSALCGFSASLSTARARALSADDRVLSVQADTGFTVR